MQVVAVEEPVSKLLGVRNERQQRERYQDPGYHIAGLLRDLQVRSGIDLAKGFTDDPTLRFEMGFVFEDVMEQYFRERVLIAYGDQVTRPGVLRMGDIVGSPDGVEHDAWRVVETKLTWAKNRQGATWVEGRWSWIKQIAAYSHMLGSDRAVLHVCHVAGNGQVPRPEVLTWELAFTPEELLGTWKMLTDHAERLRAEGKDRI